MVRKLVLLLVPVLLGCLSSWGQSVQWVYGNKALEEGAEITVTGYDPVMGQMLLEMGIRNNTGKQLKVSVSKEYQELAEGSGVQLCVGTTCYPERVAKSDEFTLEPNETNTSFHANYLITDENKAGNSTVLFKIISGAESASVKVHFNYSVAVVPALEYRRVVVGEELTATWCGFCPRGMVGMANMKEKYPDSFIGIAVHDYSYNHDPMGVRGYADGILRFITSLPKILVDRRMTGDPFFDLESMYKQEMAKPVTSAIAVSVAYTDASQTVLSADIHNKFNFDAEDASYVYALVILENEVKGTASGYAQSNNYSGGTAVMGDFHTLPSPVPASRMVYQDVARTIFPEFEGMLSSVPVKFAKDEVLHATYDVELPPNVLNKEHIELVVLLIDRSTGEIVNAAKAAPSSTATATRLISVPTTEVTAVQQGPSISVSIKSDDAVSYSVELYDASGRLVSRRQTSANTPVSFLPDHSGVYFVRVTDGKQVVVKKVFWHR